MRGEREGVILAHVPQFFHKTKPRSLSRTIFYFKNLVLPSSILETRSVKVLVRVHRVYALEKVVQFVGVEVLACLPPIAALKHVCRGLVF